jgi:hypothetical protein
MLVPALVSFGLSFIVTRMVLATFFYKIHGPNSNHVRRVTYRDDELGIAYMLEPYPVLCPV